jgi:hypothetical protein
VSGGAMEIGPNISVLMSESSSKLIALYHFSHSNPSLASRMLLGSGLVCVISLATIKLKVSST